MFWIGVTHNSIGRFYETQSYPGAGRGGGRAGAGGATGETPTNPCGRAPGPFSTFPPSNEREWYRPYPNPGCVEWSGRSNINMQESALLLTLNLVARNHEKFLENYYAKNKMMIEQGRTKAPYAYVVPARQRRHVEAADLMNLIRREGAEVQTATASFTVGGVQVSPGDYIVRLDQPYGAVVETLLGVQWYPAENPRPYDDTGWDIPVMRNLRVSRIDDRSVFDKPMALAATDLKVAGTITGSGRTLIIDHTTDNTLVTFRFRNAGVKMSAAEQAFDLDGHHFAPGAFVIPDANRAALDPQIRDLGLMAWATDAPPAVPAHELTVPRIGYLHSWSSTQDEGWVRMAFDKLHVPYSYFGDTLARQGNLRAKYDVIVYPSTVVQTSGEGVPPGNPVPYRKSDLTPNIGTAPDQTDDTRGGLGRDGLRALVAFMNEGGVLITEGATSNVLPDNHVTPGLTIDPPGDLFAPGSVIKTLLGDRTSPVLYGYDQNTMGVMYKNSPLFGLGASPHPPSTAPVPGAGGGRGAAGPVGGGSLQPMLSPPRLATLDGPAPPAAAGRGRGAGGAAPGGGRGSAGAAPPASAADLGVTAGAGSLRVLLSYPADPNDLLLSGELAGGENLAGRPVLVDAAVGKGHAVMFACRPFWRFQTQGNFFLAFNAILNWDHLDAGK
jgi:hypothetical protein